MCVCVCVCVYVCQRPSPLSLSTRTFSCCLGAAINKSSKRRRVLSRQRQVSGHLREQLRRISTSSRTLLSIHDCFSRLRQQSRVLPVFKTIAGSRQTLVGQTRSQQTVLKGGTGRRRGGKTRDTALTGKVKRRRRRRTLSAAS